MEFTLTQTIMALVIGVLFGNFLPFPPDVIAKAKLGGALSTACGIGWLFFTEFYK